MSTIVEYFRNVQGQPAFTKVNVDLEIGDTVFSRLPGVHIEITKLYGVNYHQSHDFIRGATGADKPGIYFDGIITGGKRNGEQVKRHILDITVFKTIKTTP